MSGTGKLPRWNLESVYADFESRSWKDDKEALGALGAEMAGFFSRDPGKDFRAWLEKAIGYWNRSGELSENLNSFAYVRFSTDTRDTKAMAELNAIEELSLPLKRADALWKNLLASRRDEAERLVSADARLAPFAFFVREELFWQSKQMSPELEDLAADLARSGGDAFGRLQEKVSSTTSVLWDERSGERKTVVQLRSLAFDPDRSVREKAWRKELDAWKSVEVPMAAALNGVKGWTISLNARRGWDGALDKTVEQSRMTRKTLDSLLIAMEESLPVWRKYLKAKARCLGIPACGFYDLFAPVGETTKKYSFDEVRGIVTGKFASFSPRMGAFAGRAFDGGWIDAEPREGKVGGAYCIGFPIRKESRILCNFEGSFSSLSTVAHELGHAYHGEVLKGLPSVCANYPMPLAETASIFAETVIFEEAMKHAPEGDRLALLENHLQDGCQVLVDILSRFRFEREVFGRRRKAELAPEEFCALMLEAQRGAFGDGLDGNALHPYMWAAKGHYYSPDLSFYNFPYAFGLLFGLGLYARYRAEGPAFAAAYDALLLETGRASAADIAKSAGFDIETPDFWRSGMAVFEEEAREFERLASGGDR